MTANAEAVRTWNERYPIGTPVRYWTGTRDDPSREGKTRSEAWLSQSGSPVVLVTGQAGYVALTHVDPVMTDAELQQVLLAMPDELLAQGLLLAEGFLGGLRAAEVDGDEGVVALALAMIRLLAKNGRSVATLFPVLLDIERRLPGLAGEVQEVERIQRAVDGHCRAKAGAPQGRRRPS